jgi:hypothetical protein
LPLPLLLLLALLLLALLLRLLGAIYLKSRVLLWCRVMPTAIPDCMPTDSATINSCIPNSTTSSNTPALHINPTPPFHCSQLSCLLASTTGCSSWHSRPMLAQL